MAWNSPGLTFTYLTSLFFYLSRGKTSAAQAAEYFFFHASLGVNHDRQLKILRDIF